jgi:hypothetical protein
MGGFAAWVEAGCPVVTEGGSLSGSPSSGATSEDRFTRISPEDLRVLPGQKGIMDDEEVSILRRTDSG